MEAVQTCNTLSTARGHAIWPEFFVISEGVIEKLNFVKL